MTNLLVTLFNRVFGFEYVLLKFFDNQYCLRRAYYLGERLYANPYLPRTRCRLLPGGKTDGVLYIKSWLPVTRKMEEHWTIDSE